MERIYENIIIDHLEQHRQMVFLAGPRQVGKTTLAKRATPKSMQSHYFNWDLASDRKIILSGVQGIMECFSDHISTATQSRLVILDEVHKSPNWKQMLKGYFDKTEGHLHWMVTGSAKLNVYRRGSDSMMGRYFLYHIHPLTGAECLGHNTSMINPTQRPRHLPDDTWEQLWSLGGFPEPFLKGNQAFHRRWLKLKMDQLIQEDIRDITQIQDIPKIELLCMMLTQSVGAPCVYRNLSQRLQVSEPTIRNWIETLKQLYFCFAVSPWSQNLSRALIKQPKLYCHDWSLVKDPGARLENMVACHLLKAVDYWNDLGLGSYQLHYLRDQNKREVDFLISSDHQPWMLLEVKTSSSQRLSSHLHYFNERLQAPHVFQGVWEMEAVMEDCFASKNPVVVPLKTLLTQLV